MPDLPFCFNVNALQFSSSSLSLSSCVRTSPLAIALEKLARWKFPLKIQKRVVSVLEEWYSNSTLDRVLSRWDDNPNPSISQFVPLIVLTYKVQGRGTRVLEVMDLIFKINNPIGVFTEVGEQWNKFKIPYFTSFYQKGTNRNGGVTITIGKHLKATRSDTNLENTVVVDIEGLSELIRIIGIYWPHGQVRKLNELCPFLVKGTILTGDFNVAAEE